MDIEAIDEQPIDLINGIWEGELQTSDSSSKEEINKINLTISANKITGQLIEKITTHQVVSAKKSGFRLALGWVERTDPIRKTAMGKQTGGPVYAWAGLSVVQSQSYRNLIGTYRYNGRDYPVELVRKQPRIPSEMQRVYTAHVHNKRLKREQAEQVSLDLSGPDPVLSLPWLQTDSATLIYWDAEKRQFAIACDMLNKRGKLDETLVLNGIVSNSGEELTFYLGSRRLGRGRILLLAESDEK